AQAKQLQQIIISHTNNNNNTNHNVNSNSNNSSDNKNNVEQINSSNARCRELLEGGLSSGSIDSIVDECLLTIPLSDDSAVLPFDWFSQLKYDYLVQMKSNHAEFINRVKSDLLIGNDSSLQHLQQHFNSHVNRAIQLYKQHMYEKF